MCSSVLFSLFINELTKDIIESGKHGIQLAPDLIEWLILLFADDVVLLSDSVFGLQTQMIVLFNTAKRLDLIINLDKSNIVVFRNGGHLALNEKWCFGNEEPEGGDRKAHVLTYSKRPCRSSQKGNASNYETFMVHW